jgi:hypothetical protein
MRSSNSTRVKVLDGKNVEALERFNAEHLDILHVNAASVYGEERANKLFARIKEILLLENIMLSIDAGVQALDNVAHRILSGASKKHEEDELKAWVKQYRNLEKQGDAELAQRIERQKFNITRSVLAGRPEVDTVWGDEVDMRLVLKNWMINPNVEQAYLAGQSILLPPAAIVSEAKDVLNELQGTVDTIQSVIAKIAPGAAPTNILLPLSDGGDHWKLQLFTVQNQRIIASTLTDSLTDHSEKSSIYAQTLVNKVNNDASVKVGKVATGEQTNAHSCMDYVVKKISQFFPAVTEVDRQIQKAASAEALRIAVIGKIFENHPNMLTSRATVTNAAKKNKQEQTGEPKAEPKAEQKPVQKKQPSVRDVAEKVFAPKAPTNIEDIDTHIEDIHKQLNKLSAANDKDMRQIQIDFDAKLAHHLQNADDSAQAFKEAWQFAFGEMQQHFGLFKNSKRSASPQPADTTKTKTTKVR